MITLTGNHADYEPGWFAKWLRKMLGISRIHICLYEMKERLMSKLDDVLAQINSATTNIAGRIQLLQEQIAAAATSNDDQVRQDALDAAADQLQPLADQLTAMGADADNPAPEPEPVPPVEEPPVDDGGVVPPPSDVPPAPGNADDGGAADVPLSEENF